MTANISKQACHPGTQGTKNGGTDVHLTPPAIIESLLELWGGIDTDPCCNNKENPNVPARHLYDINDNGLVQEWEGNVFVNPPYSDQIPWAAKLISRLGHETTSGVYLTKTDNRTKWFKVLMDSCDAFCLIEGYLRFGSAESSAPFPSILFYFGGNPSSFRQIFAKHGWTFYHSRQEQVFNERQTNCF